MNPVRNLQDKKIFINNYNFTISIYRDICMNGLISKRDE